MIDERLAALLTAELGDDTDAHPEDDSAGEKHAGPAATDTATYPATDPYTTPDTERATPADTYDSTESVSTPATSTDTESDAAVDDSDVIEEADAEPASPTDAATATDHDTDPATVLEDEASAEAQRAELMSIAAAFSPGMGQIANAARADIRVGEDGRIIASDALRNAMRALVPTRDKTPTDVPHRHIGGWLTVDNEGAATVTDTSPYMTVSHWHWLAAMEMVRQMPPELGATFPHLLTSEAQIMHDLTQWQALDADGQITTEAAAMFGAVTGSAELTVYGTVLLYAQKRAPVELPGELKGFGLEAAVRNVPRVTFVIGVTSREVVCAVVNNISVIFTRRLRRGDVITDAATAVLDILDPGKKWPAYPLKAPVVLPAQVVDQLAADPDASALIDTELALDADKDARAADDARRERSRKAVRAVLRSAGTPAGAQSAIADIAGATTHALAQLTVKTGDVDVSRGEPGAIALTFLSGKGVVGSYPSGSGQFRRITYTAGNKTGIENGLRALSSAYRGG